MRSACAGASVYAYAGTRPFAAALPTLLFVHGAGQDHSVWALQSRYCAYHGYNVLALDLPGHGRSAGAAPATVEAAAAWLTALLDSLRLQRVGLIGHSLGALIVLEAAARHPERVTHLALLGPAAPMPVAALLLDAARTDAHRAGELIVGWSFAPANQLGGNPWPGVWMRGNALRLLERAPPGVLHTDLHACDRYAGGLSAASRVRCPALLILGQRDQMAPPKNAAALIAALPERQVVTIPDCGHSLMSEAPDAVLGALLAFLAAR